ncbi:MAG: hypothetical protein AB7R55_22340, partial [Gemmatimonadales bacterium]
AQLPPVGAAVGQPGDLTAFGESSGAPAEPPVGDPAGRELSAVGGPLRAARKPSLGQSPGAAVEPSLGQPPGAPVQSPFGKSRGAAVQSSLGESERAEGLAAGAEQGLVAESAAKAVAGQRSVNLRRA